MASNQPQTSSMDREVTVKLLGKVAHKLYPQHLEEFATILIGLEKAAYFHIVDAAGTDPWMRCFYVLRAWYDMDLRTVRDLYRLLQQAEKREAIQRDTAEDLRKGKIWENNYLDLGLKSASTDSYPDFASMVAPWYTDPNWENMLLFPWMGDEWVLKLSEVYTRLEIETYTGKALVKETKLLKDYKELFQDVKSQGTRILVKGDPGIGKTTFTHKVAFDWATGSLSLFDLVLVIKLKFINESQRVESMVVDQLKCISDNIEVTDTLLEDYLRSGKDKVLLVLDGLDEINLKHFPQVQKILNGETYRKCCILATTRPHIAESLQNKSTSVAKILGFSKEKAEDFVTYIIPEKDKRTRFFDQLYQRNMSEMFRVPLVIQALALLFREHQQLPASYTATYDELVLYLRKTCQESKGLTEKEIQAAMAEVNELAFKGLTREDKQLVFSREEIKNENIFKLGILVAEKGGSGFRPTTVLCFLHKTLQEYCAAHHVVQRFEHNDRGPWEALVQQFHQDVEREETKVQSKSDFRIPQHRSEHDTKHLISSAIRKLCGAVKAHPERNKVIFEFCDVMMENGIYDAECDMNRIVDICWHHPIVDDTLNNLEKNALSTFLLDAYSKLTQKEKDDAKEDHLNFMKCSNTARSLMLRSFFMAFEILKPWEIVDRGMAHQMCVTPDFWRQDFGLFVQLQQTLANHKMLFSFILGKSPTQHAQYIVSEITELIVQYSFDVDKGTSLAYMVIQEGITQFVRKTRSHADSVETDNILVNNPALVQLRAPYTEENRPAEPSGLRCKYVALKVKGIRRECNSGFLSDIHDKLRTLKNVHIAEIWDVFVVNCPNTRTQFAQALCQSPFVSILLYNVDPPITTEIIANLPDSTRELLVSEAGRNIVPLRFVCELIAKLPESNRRLFISEVRRNKVAYPSLSELVANLPEPTRGLLLSEVNRKIVPSQYHFSGVVKLSSLSLENCTPELTGASFPNLRQLNLEKAPTEQPVDLLNAIGTMPKLEDLKIFHISLRGLAPHVVNMLSNDSLRFVILEDCNMSLDDGNIILQSIQDGHLDHIASLNLLGNKDFVPLTPNFTEMCDLHNIDLQISMGSNKVKPKTVQPGVMSRLLSWLHDFTISIFTSGTSSSNRAFPTGIGARTYHGAIFYSSKT